ncbi:hypothetical protein QLX67_12725, partial [Balneolaceae bacterium ANBcel3]|nr:hypothetical protein [Balneolaceae bacterium ANBcel3]
MVGFSVMSYFWYVSIIPDTSQIKSKSMDIITDQFAIVHILNQYWLTLLLVISMVLISRTFVAGTRYSPILIIVVFGLTMGYVMVSTGLATPGLPEFPMVDLTSRVTITALMASFFVGGQEIRKILTNQKINPEDMVVPSSQELFLGTKATQFMFLVRGFFILTGIEAIKRLITGYSTGAPLDQFYPLIGYIGLVASVILIDYRAKITNKAVYIRKGIIETATIILLLVIAFHIAVWVRPVIALPEIFFAMILSVTMGMILVRWQFGPTIRSLLFAGIPIVLAANFMVGGSRIAEAFMLTGMTSVLSFGFFGQLFWMFGGLTLLILFGHANHIRNLAPGMAGSLSHSGLTGACTAGDLGSQAAIRAPIMINIPFIGHIFVFSILAASATTGKLLIPYTLLVVAAGILLTFFALKMLRGALDREQSEIRGLMVFSLGWQLVAVFGGLLMLDLSGMPLADAVMANASAISHFGLFAAIQEGMFGAEAAGMIAFVFAMPFLVHPLVFGIFGKAAENDGVMPARLVYVLAGIGVLGVLYAMIG